MKIATSLPKALRIGTLALAISAFGASGFTTAALANGGDSHQAAPAGAQHAGNTGQASRPDSGGNHGEQQGDTHGVKAGESHSNDDHTKNGPAQPAAQPHADNDSHPASRADDGRAGSDVANSQPVQSQTAGVTVAKDVDSPGCAFGNDQKNGQLATAPGCIHNDLDVAVTKLHTEDCDKDSHCKAQLQKAEDCDNDNGCANAVVHAEDCDKDESCAAAKTAAADCDAACQRLEAVAPDECDDDASCKAAEAKVQSCDDDSTCQAELSAAEECDADDTCSTTLAVVEGANQPATQPVTVSPSQPVTVIITSPVTTPSGQVLPAGAAVTVTSGTILPTGQVEGATISAPGVGPFSAPTFTSQVAPESMVAGVSIPGALPQTGAGGMAS